MFGGDSMFSWARDFGQFLGGLLAMLIVGVLALGSVVWSAVEIWRRRSQRRVAGQDTS
jgi:uncharacterized protein (DUF2062 family)